jgi:hypothetical protein
LRRVIYRETRTVEGSSMKNLLSLITALLLIFPIASIAQGEYPVVTSIITSFASYDDCVGQEYSRTRYGEPWDTGCSSALPPMCATNYFAGNLLDGDLTTAWVEGAIGDGFGETFTIQAPVFESCLEETDLYDEEGDQGIDTVGYPLSHLVIYNGYQKSPELWEANGRVKSLIMWNNNTAVCIIELEDTMLPQEIDLLEELWEVSGPGFQGLSLKNDEYLRFEILEVFPGAEYEDTAITEILIFGGQGKEACECFFIASGYLPALDAAQSDPVPLTAVIHSVLRHRLGLSSETARHAVIPERVTR